MEQKNENINELGVAASTIICSLFVCLLCCNRNFLCRCIKSTLRLLPEVQDRSSNNLHPPVVFVIEDSEYIPPPPTYEVALIVSRPSTPELTRPTSNNLTHNPDSDDEQQPPVYEVAISLNSAESSRRSSNASQFTQQDIVRSHSLLLPDYEDAMRNSRPATPTSLNEIH